MRRLALLSTKRVKASAHSSQPTAQARQMLGSSHDKIELERRSGASAATLPGRAVH